jgi:hypothetical protein
MSESPVPPASIRQCVAVSAITANPESPAYVGKTLFSEVRSRSGLIRGPALPKLKKKVVGGMKGWRTSSRITQPSRQSQRIREESSHSDSSSAANPAVRILFPRGFLPTRSQLTPTEPKESPNQLFSYCFGTKQEKGEIVLHLSKPRSNQAVPIPRPLRESNTPAARFVRRGGTALCPPSRPSVSLRQEIPNHSCTRSHALGQVPGSLYISGKARS